MEFWKRVALVTISAMILAGTAGAASERGVPGDPVYDRCLATGRNKAACDAIMNTIFLKLGALRKELEHGCLPPSEQVNAGTAPGDPDPFEDYFSGDKRPSLSMLSCLDAVNKRLDGIYENMSFD